MDHGFIVGGRRVFGSTGESFAVIDPGTGEPFARVAQAVPADVDLAVREAREALEDRRWTMIAPLERGRILNRIGELVREHGDELAGLMCRENGMTLNTALYVEIPLVVDSFSYYGGLVPQVNGETLPFAVPGAPPEYLALTLKEPVGVAAQITPWNFPLLMPAWHTCPWLRKMPNSAPATAASRSASSKTMLGDLPPSSRVTRLMPSAASRRMERPVAVSPVKATFRTSGWVTSARPT